MICPIITFFMIRNEENYSTSVRKITLMHMLVHQI
jgi:hypothetical protein